MIWFTKQVEYEGLPLLLRKPDLSKIRNYRAVFSHLVCVEHSLDSVSADGLPESSYNKTLAEFDHFMCTEFLTESDGLVVFIETFSGKRNYYYYTSSGFDYMKRIEQISLRYSVELSGWSKEDSSWSFIYQYPFQLD